jgi:hypothetical protein
MLPYSAVSYPCAQYTRQTDADVAICFLIRRPSYSHDAISRAGGSVERAGPAELATELRGRTIKFSLEGAVECRF